MSNLDLFVVNVALPDIGKNFNGASLDTLSWVLNAYAIVFAALLVVAGRLADRRGHREGFLVGLFLFTLGSTLCAVATNSGFLIGSRVVQAIGAAILLPTSLALLLATAPPEKRAQIVRLWSAVGAVAAALGPAVGGLLVQASWRWVFLINVPVGIIAIVSGMRSLPEVRRPDAGPWPDLLGAVMLTVSIGLLSLGLVKGNSWGWTSGSTIGSLVGAAVLLVLFVAQSARHPAPVVELPLLKVKAFTNSSLAITLFTVAFSGMILTCVLWCQTVWGYSALKTGLWLATGPLMVPPLAIAAGPLAKKVGAGPVAALGNMLFAGGLLSFALRAHLNADFAGQLLPGFLLGGIGVGLALPTLTASAATALPPHRFATGSGIFNMARQIGAVLGVAIVVVILGTPHSPSEALTAFQHSWYAISAMCVLAAVASMLIRPGAAAPAPGKPEQMGQQRAAGAPVG